MLKLKLLGVPGLTDSDNTIVPIKNRKHLALVAYLSRLEEPEADRETLAGLLWSAVGPSEARISLRQTLKHLRKVENNLATNFLVADRTKIGLLHPIPRTDVDTILAALTRSRVHSIKKARALLPIEWSRCGVTEHGNGFLNGFVNLDPAYEVWRRTQEETIRAQFISLASEKLAGLVDPSDPVFAGLARFLLDLDRLDEWAHHLLIRHFLAADRHERAERQYAICVQALAEGLGEKPDDSTRRLLRVYKLGNAAAALPHRSVFEFTDRGSGRHPTTPDPKQPGGQGNGTRLKPVEADSFPVIHIGSESDPAPPTLSQQAPRPDDGRLRAEYVDQIARNRDLILRECPASPVNGGGDQSASASTAVTAPPVGIDDYKGGQFVLRIKENPSAATMMVELHTRSDGNPIFADIIAVRPDLGTEDRKQAIGRSVLTLEGKISKFYRQDALLNQTPYGKFVEVDELTGRFDRKSNDRATTILDEIEGKTGESGLLLAFRASLHLQSKLLMHSTADSQAALQQASALATRALALDPWHTLNHRYLGFAACYLGRQAEGVEHMLSAQSLNPQDPRQMIATAEAAAFAGNITAARSFSNAASATGLRTPRYFYGYLANIAFAAGDFDAAATFASRAPLESMDYRATRIAALWHLGRLRDARVEMQSCLAMLRRQNNDRPEFVESDFVAWMCALNPFANPQTLDQIQRGLRSVANQS